MSAKYSILSLRYTSIASELHTGGGVFPNCSCFPSAFPRDHLTVNFVLTVLPYPFTVISPYNLFCLVLFLFECYVNGLYLSVVFLWLTCLSAGRHIHADTWTHSTSIFPVGFHSVAGPELTLGCKSYSCFQWGDIMNEDPISILRCVFWRGFERVSAGKIL